MLFVRDDATGALGMLLKHLDEAVTKHEDVELRSFAVVVSSGDEGAEARLKEFTQRFEGSENVPLLTPDDPARLAPFKINPDAEVTVVLYRNFNVSGSFAFKAGELAEPGVKAIMAAIPEIIPTQEQLALEAKEREEAALLRKQAAEKLAAEKAAAEKAENE